MKTHTFILSRVSWVIESSSLIWRRSQKPRTTTEGESSLHIRALGKMCLRRRRIATAPTLRKETSETEEYNMQEQIQTEEGDKVHHVPSEDKNGKDLESRT